MNQIEKMLRERLQNTFKLYICHAIEHAISEHETENDILQVIINLQASLELLSKLYVLQSKGWQAIVESQFHKKTDLEILSHIDNGTIKTTPYWKNKEFISKEIFLDDEDIELIDNFQNNRNQVMHLGAVNYSRDVLNQAIWFIVRIIHQLNWQDTLPLRHQYMSNSLQFLLGEKLYNKLINSSCYIDEAIDRAHDLCDDIKICIQCGNESFGLVDEYWICTVCGFRGDNDAFGFTDCHLCDVKGTVVYDPFNMGNNKYVTGKCCACKELIKVSMCPQCENIFIFPGSCKYCED